MKTSPDVVRKPVKSPQGRATGGPRARARHRQRVSAQIQQILRSTTSLENTIQRLYALICNSGHKECRRKITEVCARIGGLQDALVDLALIHRQHSAEERRKSGARKRK